ncbi:MAG: alpha/beta fold hydrolase [Planctomycetota bacterium]|jgi:pimeloyl-ACP methyl ester carboxylesterase
MWADGVLVDAFADFVASVPTREVTLPFGRTTVWELGEGEPIVLIHGVSGGRRLFFRVVPELAKRYRVIVPHLRGEEMPDRWAGVDDWLDDIAALFDALDLDNVTLYGASFGGYITLAYGGRNDPRVARVVVQGSFSGFRLRLLDRAVMVASHLIPARLGSDYYAWRVVRGRETEYLREFTPGLAPLNLGWQRATPFASLRRRAQVISRIDVAPAIQRMEAPLTIGHARRDPVVPFALGQRLAQLRPDARVVTWEDGGHMQMLTHPERFALLPELPGSGEDNPVDDDAPAD